MTFIDNQPHHLLLNNGDRFLSRFFVDGLAGRIHLLRIGRRVSFLGLFPRQLRFVEQRIRTLPRLILHPSINTVHNILGRHGLIVPKPAPQAVREVIDRHYPAFTVSQPGQLQQLDLVGPRYLQGSSQKYYFYNLRDVCSRRIAVEAGKNHQAHTICQALINAWQRMGMPTILQHDNSLEFRGSNQSPRTAGLLTKLCVALQIESVFVPAREPYRNGTIENFNGLFQRLVLQTQHLENFLQLQHEGSAFELIANTQHPHVPLNGKTSEEYEQSLNFNATLLSHDFKLKTPFHVTPTVDSNVSFICRIQKSGKITIASEKFLIDSDLAWDYVYATICVKERVLKIYHNTTLRL